MPQRPAPKGPQVEIVVRGPIWEWRGPAPYYFVSITGDEAEQIRELAASLTYGWGMILVNGVLGNTEFTTSLWSKDGGYVIPMKDALRKAEGVGVGDEVTIVLLLEMSDSPLDTFVPE